MNIQEAYYSILDILDDHEGDLNLHASQIRSTAENHLLGLELQAMGYRLDPKDIHSTDYHKVNPNVFIGMWGGPRGRSIPYPDDDKMQFSSETAGRFLVLQFPTGPYVFGDEYNKPLFDEFFNELKSYYPIAVDTTNSSLYFHIEFGADVFNAYNDIFNKYYEIAAQTTLASEIEALEKRLADLKKPK